MANKTALRDYETFRRECLRLLDVMQLSDWQIEVDAINDSEVAWTARTYFNNSAKAARIVWNKNSISTPTDIRTAHTSKYVALHECLHILLHSLVFTAVDQKDMSSVLIDAEEHAVINRIVRLLAKAKK